jgi:hypothetical protein
MLTDSDGTESIKPDSRVLKQIAASDSNAASEAGRNFVTRASLKLPVQAKNNMQHH